MAAAMEEEMNNFYLHLSNNPIRFEPLTSVTTVFFDEANQQLFVIRLNGRAVTVKGPTDKLLTFSLADKGELKSIKFSLDQKILAIQRSPRSVDFVNFPSGPNAVEYSQSSKGKSSIILCFYWMGPTEIVFVTDKGLEYYQVIPDKKTLKLIKPHTMTVNWSVCLNESSVILASSGSLGTTLYPFHFKAGVMTKLTKFEVELPSTPGALLSSLKQTDVTLANIYGQLHAMVMRHNGVNSRGGTSSEVVLYQIPLAKDQAIKQTDVLRLDLNGLFSINVLDNLIVVNHQASKTSMLFDIRATGDIENGITYHRLFLCPLPIRPFRLQQTGVSNSGAPEVQECNCELYSLRWAVFQPDIVLDVKYGCFWFLHLNLDSIVTMVTDKCRLVQFLLRRRSSKDVLLTLCRGLLTPGKQASLGVIASVLDSINHAYSLHLTEAEAARSSNKSEGGSDEERRTPVIDQSDMFTHVFSVFDDSNDKFVVAVMTEYIRSLGAKNITVQHFIYELVVTTLVHSQRYYQLHQFLQYHILSDSKPLAFKLLSLESSYQPSYQLALDMLKRLGTANDSILEVLIAKQQLLSALRFVQSTGSADQTPARKFLETAKLTQNDQLFYTVFKFFEQRNVRMRYSPKFQPGEYCDEYVEHFKLKFGMEAVKE